MPARIAFPGHRRLRRQMLPNRSPTPDFQPQRRASRQIRLPPHRAAVHFGQRNLPRCRRYFAAISAFPGTPVMPLSSCADIDCVTVVFMMPNLCCQSALSEFPPGESDLVNASIVRRPAGPTSAIAPNRKLGQSSNRLPMPPSNNPANATKPPPMLCAPLPPPVW